MLTDMETFRYLLPELILVLFAVAVFIGGTWNRTRTGWAALAIGAFGLASLVMVPAPIGVSVPPGISAGNSMSSSVIADPMSHSMRVGALGLGMLFCLFATQTRPGGLFPELLGSLVLMIAGLMLVCSAGDLVLLLVGLELISIPTYVLLFIGRDSRDADEAAGKYFLLSIFSSAMLLYGFTTLYGLAGDVQFAGIQASLSADVGGVPFPLLYPIAIGMILVGFCFKIAAVPFQFYAPDVYQATTNFSASLLAVVPKIAGVVGLIRIFAVALPHEATYVWQLLVVLAMLTMTVGNVAALWQHNIRRMMAYSSIAHSGYLLIGLATIMGAVPGDLLGRDGVAAMIYYVMAYSVATIGTFAALGYLTNEERQFCNLEQLTGVGKRHPVIGGILTCCMFSLAGIPPLAGFWGKFTLFRTALEAGLGGEAVNYWFVALCVVGVLNAAIAAGYYLKVIAGLYFQPTTSEASSLGSADGSNTGAGLAAVASGLLLVSVGLFAGPAMSCARQAADPVWGAISVYEPGTHALTRTSTTLADGPLATNAVLSTPSVQDKQ